jgi:hypothetical protein
MFDDLRNSSEDQDSFFKEEEVIDPEIAPLLEKKPPKADLGIKIKFNSKNFLGMNAFQRFFISVLLFLMVCILGTMLLMVTETIVF